MYLYLYLLTVKVLKILWFSYSPPSIAELNGNIHLYSCQNLGNLKLKDQNENVKIILVKNLKVKDQKWVE